jgi:cytochrome oxidase assembly protein ShyY1
MQEKVTIRKKKITLFVIFMLLILFLYLSMWQLNKHFEQQIINENFLAINSMPPIENYQTINFENNIYRKVQLTGKWDHSNIQFIRNIIRYDTAGKDILVPLIVNNKLKVLVNRGWVPNEIVEKITANLKKSNSASIVGRIYMPPVSKVKLLKNGDWLGVSIEEIEKKIDYPLSSWMIIESAQLLSENTYNRYNIFPKEFPDFQNIIFKNNALYLGYAITWFSFSILSIFGIIHVLRN